MFSSSDSLAVTGGVIAGISGGTPPEAALVHSVILQIAIKLIMQAPNIIRAIKARRTARKAAKNA